MALLQHRDDVAGAVARLVTHGQQHVQLSGDTGCRVECTKLEQVARDVYGKLLGGTGAVGGYVFGCCRMMMVWCWCTCQVVHTQGWARAA